MSFWVCIFFFINWKYPQMIDISSFFLSDITHIPTYFMSLICGSLSTRSCTRLVKIEQRCTRSCGTLNLSVQSEDGCLDRAREILLSEAGSDTMPTPQAYPKIPIGPSHSSKRQLVTEIWPVCWLAGIGRSVPKNWKLNCIWIFINERCFIEVFLPLSSISRGGYALFCRIPIELQERVGRRKKSLRLVFALPIVGVSR
jgi:hypothetical protein